MKRLVIVVFSMLGLLDCFAMDDTKELAHKEMGDQSSLLRLKINTNCQQEKFDAIRTQRVPRQGQLPLPESFLKPAIFSRDVSLSGASSRMPLCVKEEPEKASVSCFKDDAVGSFIITHPEIGQDIRVPLGDQNSMIGSLVQNGEPLRASDLGFTDLSKQVINNYDECKEIEYRQQSKLSSGFVVQHLSLLELLQKPEYQDAFDACWKNAGVDYTQAQARSISVALAAFLEKFHEQCVTLTLDDEETLPIQGLPIVLPSGADLIKAIIGPLQPRNNESKLQWDFPYPCYPEVAVSTPKLYDSTGQETTAHRLWCGD